jgi:hypothetical protein
VPVGVYSYLFTKCNFDSTVKFQKLMVSLLGLPMGGLFFYIASVLTACGQRFLCPTLKLGPVRRRRRRRRRSSLLYRRGALA